ncbi:Tim10/DDP family zinc finger-domain-containing protein [Xylariomycetidae sp. FL2044]|nr:Tim10/DDP family zinc finger-domain-containing protein [Xylariomycetidae sp. FL2044]
MDSESVKSEVMRQVRTQYAMENARQLIEKINEHCFAKCITKPGASLSSGEQTCVSACMEKYMTAWNQVSTTYINRLQQEQQQL